jgi:hypothetical protein
MQAYEYFSSGWLQEGYFLKAKSNNNNNLCILRTKYSPSQTLDDDPHNGLTRTALCLSKNLVAKLHTMIMFIKPTRINLKGVCNSTLTQNVQSVHHHRHRMMIPTMYRYCAKEDDGLTEGAYCSCTAGYEIYACFF